jgi:hypothetical protein
VTRGKQGFAEVVPFPFFSIPYVGIEATKRFHVLERPRQHGFVENQFLRPGLRGQPAIAARCRGVSTSRRRRAT